MQFPKVTSALVILSTVSGIYALPTADPEVSPDFVKTACQKQCVASFRTNCRMLLSRATLTFRIC